jgi:hypothetical protein
MFTNHAIIRIAKATDENLTSENWEYILVRVAEQAVYRFHDSIDGGLRAWS